MILFQVSASHSSYLLDQLNLAFKCFWANACSRRRSLVVFTNTKLDKSHSSIICFTVFFKWTFAVLINFHTIFCAAAFAGDILSDLKHFQSAETSCGFLRSHFLKVKVLSLLLAGSYSCPSHYLHIYYFWKFLHDFRCKYIHYIQEKKAVLLQKNVFINGGTLFCFYILCTWGDQKHLYDHFGGDDLVSSSLI